jgi:1,4-dihydroxy-2-naphthoyl-CoA hydrolase
MNDQIQIEEAIKEKAEQLFSGGQQTMGEALGIRYIKLSRDEMVAEMPVNKNTIQPFGILHGGASVALAETLSSIGAWLNLDSDDKTAVGLEINANHIKVVRKGGMVRGIARPIHRGVQTQVWETRIETDSGKLVCISRCTLAVIKRR